MKIDRPVMAARKLKRLREREIENMNKDILSELLSAVKPDYSDSTLPALEIKKTRFKYNKPDFSRSTENMTEDEIIESVLFPDKNIFRKVSIIEYANAGKEVQEYWRSKIVTSELKRGRAYKKLQE